MRHSARNHALLLIMYRHGLRVSEAVGLRQEHLSPERSRIWVKRLKGSLSAEYPDAVVQRAVTQPKSFDIIDSEYWMLAKIVPSGNLQPMDTEKIKLFDKIVPIFTKGELGGKPSPRRAPRLSR